MKALGVVRKIDGLGRIVLPIEVRRVLGLGTGVSVEMFVEDDVVMIKKYSKGCSICGGLDYEIHEIDGITICERCVTKIKSTR